MRSVSVPGSAAPKITGSRVVAIGESRSVMTSAATGLSQNTQSAQFVPDHGGVLYAHETMTAPEDEDLLSYVQCVGLDSDLDPGGCVPSAHVESDPRCVSAIPRGFDRDMHLPVISLVQRAVSDSLASFIDVLGKHVSSGAPDVFWPDPVKPRAPLAQDRVSPAITCQLVFSQREDEQDLTQAAGHPVKISTGELVGVKDGGLASAIVSSFIAVLTAVIGSDHVAEYLLLNSLDPHAVLDVGDNKSEVSLLKIEDGTDSDTEGIGLCNPGA